MHKRKTDKEFEAFVSADKYVRGLVETFFKIPLPAKASDVATKLAEYVCKDDDDPMYAQAAILTWSGYGMEDTVEDGRRIRGHAANFTDGALKYASENGFNINAVISIGAIIDSVYRK